MALNLDKEYTERPEDQTKCVYCGNELGHKYKWAMAVQEALRFAMTNVKQPLKVIFKKIKKEKQLCLCLYL